MEIRFIGAARTTTGSMHLLSANDRNVLLDCGLYQGKRKEAFERNRNLRVRPGKLDSVVLSHAHIDHSGNLPTLVRRGYTGAIYATPATIDLCDIMLRQQAAPAGRQEAVRAAVRPRGRGQGDEALRAGGLRAAHGDRRGFCDHLP